MIDFHNHILPSIDDGAKSIEISLSMLKFAEEQGITDVVNTVHFQHPKVEGRDISFSKISREIDNLKDVLKKNNIDINIHIGSEVFFLPNLAELIDNPLATMGNGKYMLIEFHPFHIPAIHKKVFFDLKMKGVTPIIAHPERYKEVHENTFLVADWLEAGCLVQVDAGSPLGLLGEKAKSTSEIIIKNNWFQLIGSDAHDNKNRNFCLKESLNQINEIGRIDVKQLVIDNPQKIMRGEPISIDVNYQNHADKISFLDKLNFSLKKKR